MREEQVENDSPEIEEKHYREVAVPGEFIDDKKGRKFNGNVYLEGDKVFSRVLGIPIVNDNEIRVVPMSGVYMPEANDKVVAVITQVEYSGWIVGINSPYEGFLPVSEGVDEFVDTNRMDISKFFDVGDVVFCKISKVTKNKNVRLTMRCLGARKLYGGVVLNVKPTKVPRIIGREGSMVNMIKNKTGCMIYIGKNGVIWVKGENKDKAIEAILTVEKESNSTGLTEKIEKLLGGLDVPAVKNGDDNGKN